jgi:lipoprotein-anchoring transpeptidase ErfK/SrfK
MSHPAITSLRSPGLRRGIVVLAVALAAPVHAATAEARVARSEPLVELRTDHVARTRPSVRAHRIEVVAARRPLTGVSTRLPVLDHEISPDGRSWVRVRLPGRPSGHTGWIPMSHTRNRSTPWRIAVKLSTRRVTVFQDGRVVRRFRAIVGAPSTPTPQGSFFIEESLALSSSAPGNPFALATSARSSVLQEFDGGPGQVALHGMDGLPGALGTASSHGCIRLSRTAITWIAQRIGGGVPVTVTR